MNFHGRGGPEFGFKMFFTAARSKPAKILFPFSFKKPSKKTFSARTNVRSFLSLSSSASFAGCATAAEEEIHPINIISMQIDRRLYLFSDLWRAKMFITFRLGQEKG